MLTVQHLAEDEIVPPSGYDHELTYFADGTPIEMRADGAVRCGIAAGVVFGHPGMYAFQRVNWLDGGQDDVSPYALHRTEA